MAAQDFDGGSSQDCDRWNREQDDGGVFDEQPQKSPQQSKVKVFSSLIVLMVKIGVEVENHHQTKQSFTEDDVKKSGACRGMD